MRNPRNLFTGRPIPTLVLNRAETLALLADPGDFVTSKERFSVKSEYLCDFMNDLELTGGFVYNTSAMRAFEQAHALPQFNDNGSALSLLVYNAQGYRRGDQLVADGWLPGSDLLEQAYQTGAKLLVQGESMLGGKAEELLNVRMIEGKLYAMRPRKRNYGVKVWSLPCKLVGGKSRKPAPAPPELILADAFADF